MNILIVEDDEMYLNFLKKKMSNYFTVYSTKNTTYASIFLKRKKISAAFIDLDLGNGVEEGLEIVKACKEMSVEEITVLTNLDSDEEIISMAYLNGATNFISKTSLQDRADILVKNLLNKVNEKSLKEILKTQFVTKNESLINEIKLLSNPFLIDKSLLLLGKTGTGKTTIARIIHDLSGKKGKFVNLNCAEFSEELLSSELFGHKKGAFTGAIENKQGKLSVANNGTLFLDEVSSMSLSVQNKLLKALEEKEYYPVGSNHIQKSNFRVICASKDDIFSSIKKSLFREDLYYRISNLSLKLPSLKERKGEIPFLIEHFSKKNIRKIVFSKQAMTKLIEYDWEGNIRELKNFIEVISISKNGFIQLKDLPINLIHNNGPLMNKGTNKILRQAQVLGVKKMGLKRFINKIEEEILETYYQINGGAINKTSKDLGISRTVFYGIEKRIPDLRKKVFLERP